MVRLSRDSDWLSMQNEIFESELLVLEAAVTCYSEMTAKAVQLSFG